jgi:hypothetical protein
MNGLLAQYPDYTPLECWIANNGKLAGTDNPSEIVVDYKHSTFFLFPGKAKKYIVITNDNRIDRQKALSFCLAYHFGAFKLLHIDLRTL